MVSRSTSQSALDGERVAGVEVSSDEAAIETPPDVGTSRTFGAHVAPARHRRRAMSRKANLVALPVVVFQIVAVIVFSTITIMHYPLWSPVDEGAHFDNIVYIAEHGSYPVLGKALASEQELAIGKGVYPKRTTVNPVPMASPASRMKPFSPRSTTTWQPLCSLSLGIITPRLLSCGSLASFSSQCPSLSLPVSVGMCSRSVGCWDWRGGVGAFSLRRPT